VPSPRPDAPPVMTATTCCKSIICCSIENSERLIVAGDYTDYSLIQTMAIQRFTLACAINEFVIGRSVLRPYERWF
jgi:hypothetical protein